MGARVFLDANVLFSAAYREDAGLLELWRIPKVTVLTSGYAAEEARRSLPSGEMRSRLERLLARTEIVPEAALGNPPVKVDLPEKDRPILSAAIAGGATHLLTGDVADFGPYFGKRIEGLRVLTPSEFLTGTRRGT